MKPMYAQNLCKVVLLCLFALLVSTTAYASSPDAEAELTQEEDSRLTQLIEELPDDLADLWRLAFALAEGHEERVKVTNFADHEPGMRRAYSGNSWFVGVPTLTCFDIAWAESVPTVVSRSGEVVGGRFFFLTEGDDPVSTDDILLYEALNFVMTWLAAATTFRCGDVYWPIIESIGPPCSVRDAFSITFSRQRYLLFVDIISEYTGIPIHRIEAWAPDPEWTAWVEEYLGVNRTHAEEVEEVLYFDYGFGPIHIDDLHLYADKIEQIVEEAERAMRERLADEAVPYNMDAECIDTYNFVTNIVMGSAFFTREFAGAAAGPRLTVGHATDAGGHTFITASHGQWRGETWRRAYAHIGGIGTQGTFVGFTGIELHIPGSGVDAAAVRLNSGFRVTHQSVPTITNFSGARPANNTAVRAFGANSGVVSGTVTDNNARRLFGGNQFERMIQTSMWLGSGDSGAALIAGTTVVGTLSFGSLATAQTYFSAAENYRDVR